MSAMDVGALIGLGEHGGGPDGDVIAMYIHKLYTQLVRVYDVRVYDVRVYE